MTECKIASIDINSDFLTFKEQVAVFFSDFYADQSELFFDRAVALAKGGFKLSAINTGKFAFSLGQYQSDSYRNIYLILFLCQIHLDNNMIKEAKAYCELGFKLLDKDDPDYDKDHKSFLELQEIIKGDEWKSLI